MSKKSQAPSGSPALAKLQTALLKLAATRSGFEGLTAALVEAASGGAVRLMSSGDQQGVDAIGGASANGPRRAMQSKRYKPSTALDLNGLLGEMTRADAQFRNIDCWIMASTKAVLGKEAEALESHATALGWKLILLDWSDERRTVPPLAALCAAFPKITVAYAGMGRLAKELASIAATPDFPTVKDQVLRDLKAVDTGFIAARQAAGERLAMIFQNRATARRIAGSSPALLEEAPPVERPGLAASIQAWWKGDAQVLALLGTEGNGKTWAALQALAGAQASSGAPIPLVMSSARVAEPRDALDALISELVDVGDWAKLRLRDPASFWRRRLRIWAQPGEGDQPRIVLLVDGLDEIDGKDWDEWLSPLLTPEFSGLVRIILTCRHDDWQRRIALRDLTPAQLQILAVGRFDPQERDAYLTARGVNVAGLSEEVLREALHPRTAFHVTRLAADLPDLKRLTREQLLLLDFAARWEIRRGPLRPEVFRELVARLARQAQEAALSQANFATTDARLIGDAADVAGRDKSEMRRALSELVSSRWWERSTEPGGEIEFTDEALPDAIGLALADDLQSLSAEEVGREIDRFLEPWGADDLIEAVLRMAATALLTNSRVSDAVCRVVLDRWFARSFHGRAGQDFWRRLHIVRPDLFLDFAEQNGSHHHEWLTEWAIACFWEDHQAGRALVDQRISHWLRILPLPPEKTGDNRSWVALQNRPRKRQLQRAKALRRVGSTDLADRLTSEKTGPATALLAVRILSFLPRAPFVDAIVDWAITITAADRDDDVEAMAALVRENEHDHDETVKLLREKAEGFLSSEQMLSKKAGAALLGLSSLPEDAALAAPWVRSDRQRAARPAASIRMEGGVLTRTGNASRARPEFLIRDVARFAVQPDAQLARSLAADLTAAVASLTPDTVPDWLEHDFAMLSTIARWEPEYGRALIRDFLRKVPGLKADETRAREDYRRVTMAALPILSPEEIVQSSSHLLSLIEQKGAGRAAALLVSLVQAPLPQQIHLLLNNPIEHWPTERRYLLQPPRADDITALASAVDPAAPAGTLKPRLVLLRELASRTSEKVAVSLDWTALFGHKSSEVVLASLRLARRIGSVEAARALAASRLDPATLPEANDHFDYSEVLALVEDSDLLPLLDRLDTETWLRLYHSRPPLRESIKPLLLRWVEESLLTKRTSWGLGGGYFDYDGRQSFFDLFVDENLEEVSRLLRCAWDDEALRSNIRHDHGAGPAWPLLAAYIRHDAAFVSGIWKDVVSTSPNMWIGIIEQWPAALPPGPEADVLRHQMLSRPQIDTKLFAAVTRLQEEGHEALVLTEVHRLLCSGRAVDRARGMTIASFLEPTVAVSDAWTQIEALEVSDWLRNVRDEARAWRENAIALRHWSYRAINEESEMGAWSAAINMAVLYDGRCSYLYDAPGFRPDRNSWRAQWLDLLAPTRRLMRDNRLRKLEKSKNLAPRTNRFLADSD